MRPQLYINEISPSSTAIILTAKALDLSLEIKQVENFEKCNKLNLHSTSILKDNGYVIWDSHAIMAFLVGKYGKDESLYPRQSQIRSVIDQALAFDSGVVSFFTTILDATNCNCDETINKINDIYKVLEHFFDGDNKWIAGNNLTIADLTLIPSITALNMFAPIEAHAFPKLYKWIGQAELCSFYDPNREALLKLKNQLLIC